MLLTISFVLTGCFSNNTKNIASKFIKKVDKTKNYYLTGNLEITNNEDTYSYDVNVSYKDDDYFKVSLKNKTNNHEQIILKNDEGVYVQTHKSTKQKLNVI
jgi:outer membrane lipoprotein-sorting protein